ncbi:MAG: SMP-30/gluconolactonase/LRE family protein [Thermoguttaceae bacterium]
MNRLASRTSVMVGSLLAACLWACSLQAADPVTAPSPPQSTARALMVLPGNCNTTDGMCLLPDNSFLISVPNFNDEKDPPTIVHITGDNKAEVFYAFPTPYPGLAEPVNRIRPMGISRAPDGDLYLADMQYLIDPNQKSRLWRLAVKENKVEKMVLVACGFHVANGTAVHQGYCYITESVLEEGSHPLSSAVLRFKLDEEHVTLTTPLAKDPHIIATFTSHKNDWRFGADGIAFDSKGNLFVGLFGEGQIFKVEFDEKGDVVSNRLFCQSPGKLINCDGMSCDLRTDNLYVADSAANAIQIVSPDGKVETLAQNADVADKTSGQLDQPCEALVRGDEVIVSNMDWPFPGMRNSKHTMPAVISIIKMKK